VQSTAVIGVVSVLITVTICASGATLVMHVLMMNVRSDRICERLRAGQWRRHGTRELGDHEHRDQPAVKAVCRPEPLHERGGTSL
jgi:hypothetical protein